MTTRVIAIAFFLYSVVLVVALITATVYLIKSSRRNKRLAKSVEDLVKNFNELNIEAKIQDITNSNMVQLNTIVAKADNAKNSMIDINYAIVDAIIDDAAHEKMTNSEDTDGEEDQN